MVKYPYLNAHEHAEVEALFLGCCKADRLLHEEETRTILGKKENTKIDFAAIASAKFRTYLRLTKEEVVKCNPEAIPLDLCKTDLTTNPDKQYTQQKGHALFTVDSNVNRAILESLREGISPVCGYDEAHIQHLVDLLDLGFLKMRLAEWSPLVQPKPSGARPASDTRFGTAQCEYVQLLQATEFVSGPGDNPELLSPSENLIAVCYSNLKEGDRCKHFDHLLENAAGLLSSCYALLIPLLNRKEPALVGRVCKLLLDVPYEREQLLELVVEALLRNSECANAICASAIPHLDRLAKHLAKVEAECAMDSRVRAWAKNAFDTLVSHGIRDVHALLIADLLSRDLSARLITEYFKELCSVDGATTCRVAWQLVVEEQIIDRKKLLLQLLERIPADSVGHLAAHLAHDDCDPRLIEDVLERAWCLGTRARPLVGVLQQHLVTKRFRTLATRALIDTGNYDIAFRYWHACIVSPLDTERNKAYQEILNLSELIDDPVLDPSMIDCFSLVEAYDLSQPMSVPRGLLSIMARTSVPIAQVWTIAVPLLERGEDRVVEGFFYYGEEGVEFLANCINSYAVHWTVKKTVLRYVDERLRKVNGSLERGENTFSVGDIWLVTAGLTLILAYLDYFRNRRGMAGIKQMPILGRDLFDFLMMFVRLGSRVKAQEIYQFTDWLSDYSYWHNYAGLIQQTKQQLGHALQASQHTA